MEHIDSLVQTLEKYNAAYRSGEPLVSDHEYDSLVEKLREMDPEHPFLTVVEPEKFEGKIEVRHPMPMLSIEKSYTRESLERFIGRVKKEAAEIQVYDIIFRVTPKLDGLAGRDDGTILATRGNGDMGYDVTSVFEKGVVPIGGRGQGVGEIVIVSSYFAEHLAEEFEHPRNMAVGIVSSDKLNEFARQTLQDKMVHFVPYTALPYWEGDGSTLLNDIERITADIERQTDYPMDGMVASVTNGDVREYMGATAHHYRWQIAIKNKGATAVTVVENIQWQVGRTGNVTPVLEVRPVSLSGATIRRVTAHHAGLVVKHKIGINTPVEIIRSGEVIPKIEKVMPGEDDEPVTIPVNCPTCASPLAWNNDFLKCTNLNCPSQIVQRIYHWFKTLGNADWYGIKTIEKIVENGIDTLEKIYQLTETDFVNMGFGPVQSKNLADALVTSRTKSVEDWRFLAALGISNLGKGDSRKLLSHFPIENLTELTAEAIQKIHGFGEITSQAIESGIKTLKGTILHMRDLGFELEKTPLANANQTVASPISGKGVVFTGKMVTGSRENMQAIARKLGANVQTSVSGKTDYLVCGENVGAKKIEKAQKSGVAILNEKEYFRLIDLPENAGQ